MAAAGAVAVWLGGGVFTALALVVTGLLVQELAAMTTPGRPLRAWGLGLFAVAMLALVFWLHNPFMLVLLGLPSLVGLWRIGRERLVWLVYALAMMLTGYGLVAIRAGLNPPAGMLALMWIIALVVASDVMGYFAGRLIGGPKFWPKVSPKKTWSGAIGGAVAGMVGGYLVWRLMPALQGVTAAGPVVAASLAGSIVSQAGDLFESSLKRRFDAKDSSKLIPGHGGFLDRLDGYWAVLVLAGFALFALHLNL